MNPYPGCGRSLYYREDNQMDTTIVNDFSHDVTDDLQALLDGSNRDIYLPGGTYKISRPLRIHSNTRLSLAPDATIRLADGVMSIMLTCATHNPHGFTDCANVPVTSNITIRGGCWDANNMHVPQPHPMGTTFLLASLRNALIEDLIIKDPLGFSITLSAEYFTVQNIYFDHNMHQPNMDGVHVLSPSRFGHIRNIKGPTNDDMVALNAGDVGLVGDITDISVDGLYAENCYTGVRLLSAFGSKLERVSISNVFGSFRYSAVSITHHYLESENPCWLDHIAISKVFASKAGEELRRPGMYEKNDKWGRETQPLIWFADDIRSGHVSVSEIYRDEQTDTAAELIRIDEDVHIDCLDLVDLYERRLLRRDIPMVYNAGKINQLHISRARSNGVRFRNEGEIKMLFDDDLKHGL